MYLLLIRVLELIIVGVQFYDHVFARNLNYTSNTRKYINIQLY